MLVIHPPVDAPIVRPFSYAGSPFARGLHRGVDFGAPPGSAVRAPCSGTIVYAGTTVTLRCAGWRVTLLPLADVRARKADAVGPGTTVGAVGRDPDHAGLHLGVRRPGDPFGYVDPARFLRAPSLGPAPPPAIRTERPRPKPPRPAPAPTPAPATPLAPWPAWAGAAAALLAAVGRRRAHRRRRRRLEPATARKPARG